jgi:hypothetical protein
VQTQTGAEDGIQSGRPDSNRRRPAWEAGILPLNYARVLQRKVQPKNRKEKRRKPAVYFAADASRKLFRSGSLIAGSPGDTLSSRPSRIHRSSSPTKSKR